jgi:8-amino-7-oxononanoate synthase
MGRWTAWAEDRLDEVRATGQWRAPRPFDACGPAGLIEGRPVTSFASNDYLGLSAHPAVRAAAHDAIERWGTGATASRYIVGSRPCHHELEAELAAWKGAERAVLFPTGFAANLGVLGALAGRGVTVLSDALNHASIIDGCRASGATVRVYRHGDVDHARAELAAAAGPCVVVTDAVFSMDGDEAPVADLAEVCARHDALLVLDEAHAVLGPDVELGNGPATIRVGTLSKALGALGGFAAGPAPLIEVLVNRARPAIFSTALSPPDAAAALAALRIARGDEGTALRRRLRDLVDAVAPGHPSPIVPVVVGTEQAALDAAAALLARGVLVPAVRPPTVPPGTSRLRITLSAGHTDEMVACLVAQLAALGLGRR